MKKINIEGEEYYYDVCKICKRTDFYKEQSYFTNILFTVKINIEDPRYTKEYVKIAIEEAIKSRNELQKRRKEIEKGEII